MPKAKRSCYKLREHPDENWGHVILKRRLSGTYVSVEPFHLFRYLDEQAYRYNNRKDENENPMTDFDCFKLACSQIVGKRFTWDNLTGKQPDQETSVN